MVWPRAGKLAAVTRYTKFYHLLSFQQARTRVTRGPHGRG